MALKTNRFWFWSLIIGLLLSSCGNQSVTLPSPADVTVTPVHANTAILSCEASEHVPLLDTILTPEDMIMKYPIFESDNRWLEFTDLTNELIDANRCALDCAKQLAT